MGFMDLFGGGKSRLQKHVVRAKNKDAQSADRFVSLEALRDAAAEGSEEAMTGLLGRFTMRYQKSIEDEQEKQWVFDELVGLGKKVLGPLQGHLRGADSIAWGLKVLHEVASADEAWPILADLCERNDNSYTRDPSKKIQLLHYLGESSDGRAAAALVPYLVDMDEGVRFVTVEGLLHHKDRAVAAPPLLTLLTNEKEESRRIKKRIVDGFAELGWEVTGQEPAVERLLADLEPGARLDHGKIKRPKS